MGYSPRSVTGHDVDNPEDKRNTGELCIWNVDDVSMVPWVDRGEAILDDVDEFVSVIGADFVVFGKRVI